MNSCLKPKLHFDASPSSSLLEAEFRWVPSQNPHTPPPWLQQFHFFPAWIHRSIIATAQCLTLVNVVDRLISVVGAADGVAVGTGGEGVGSGPGELYMPRGVGVG